MSIWFNDKTPRRIKLRQVIGMVGKEPTKQKRILCKWTMYLDSGGENQIAGLPEWLEADRDHIMRHGGMLKEEYAIKGVHFTMGDADLFGKTPVEMPLAQIDHFAVLQMGKSDDPDTAVTFQTRTAYAQDLWNWLGTHQGDEFDVTFEQTLPVTSTGDQVGLQLTSESDDEDDSDDDEDDASEDYEEDYDAARREATSPKHDAEFGVSAAAKEANAVAAAKKNLSIM